ncbi:M42 family metallopeptidase [Papillibacter cinnamivorans]|uniref:Endoglucanase n=1 Tax=Papillibacter cinnamivorans DSM 12816 TaxID=1122930 RepID=A0A1W1ZQP7_9FIRM|nr:M42 family metallopeptidase [Papillibacter cinnamivorans]SMC50736.1 endoglucanase [Papillibacter cinnamivorans DSM 12816]
MHDEMLQTLKELCALDGVSGFEDEVRSYIRKKAEPYAQEIREDINGNLMVFRRGSSNNGKTRMLCAHMDEVGVMVTAITDEGYLKFDFVGGVDRRVALGRRIFLGEARVSGVIGLKAIHLVTEEERKKVPKLTELYIDIGASGREEAERLVSLGEYGAFESVGEEFGEGFFKAKALDDRIGCAVLLRLIEEDPAADTWFVFTVQEEVGTRGAFGAAFALRPDYALTVEATTAADMPGLEPHKQVCAPGKGAVLVAMDGGTIYDRRLFEALREHAENKKIPWQMKQFISGGTDAKAIQRSRAGVRTAGIAAAVRYIHSPACVFSIKDLDALTALARGFIEITGGTEV